MRKRLRVMNPPLIETQLRVSVGYLIPPVVEISEGWAFVLSLAFGAILRL